MEVLVEGDLNLHDRFKYLLGLTTGTIIAEIAVIMVRSAVRANSIRLILPVDIWTSPMAGIFNLDHPAKKARTVSLLDTKTSMVNIFADFIEKSKIAIF